MLRKLLDLVARIERDPLTWPTSFKHLIAVEWEVVPRQSQHGIGDLVFSNDDASEFMVVEVKSMRTDAGPRKRESNRRARTKE